MKTATIEPSPAETVVNSGPINSEAPPPFAIRQFGEGRVAIVGVEDALAGSPDLMAWLLNQLGSRQLATNQRHGLSLTRENRDVFDYLIEGTGRVPVLWFLGFISLFVVVIGPVNYLWLNRSRRLYMLLVTVPIGAAIVTASLFGYALLSDGLGTQLRARSYSHIDQRTGRLAGWSRQTYYAGLAPSGGLKFPRDTAVYPIDEFPSERNRRELAWSDEEQQLRLGYLSSRESTQFLTVRSGETSARLLVEPGAGGTPPRVTNELGATITHLMLRDKDGLYYRADDVEAGATVMLTRSTQVEAGTPIVVFAQAVRPRQPDGYSEDLNRDMMGFRRSRYYYNYGYNVTATSGNSVLESELSRFTNTGLAIAPGSYAALMSEPSLMPVGYSRVKEKGSLHLIEGQW
jgi:hypothetical protein